MHFYSDRMAVIQLDRGTSSFAEKARTLLFTSLTLHAAKVMFNTELGDLGELTTRSCTCAFGELGFNVHLSAVRSHEKITVEGMTVLTAELDSIIGAEVEKAGGQPDSYQFWEVPDPSGLHRLIVSVSPEVRALDETRLVDGIIAALRRDGPRKAMAAQFWGQAESFRVIREYPQSEPWPQNARPHTPRQACLTQAAIWRREIDPYEWSQVVVHSEGPAIITFINRTSWLIKMNYFFTRWTRRGNSS